VIETKDREKRNYFPETNIELVDRDVPLGEVEHLIFDHDGTLSTLRQGWEEIMEPFMVQAVCGGDPGELPEGKREEIRTRVREYIAETTGVQTIVQMKGLREMVKEYGLVEEEDLSTARAYKEIYNRRLLKPVNRRLEMLRTGRLDVSDLTVKGCSEFVRRLYLEGVTLYLASGTDREDVIRENGALGLKSYFEGRIYGAVGSIEDYSKEQVIRDILEENELEGRQFACIGDGPVEIEKTKEAGGLAICLASDEKRRWGLNEWKRKRGIEHGADLVLPDFSCWPQLLRLLVGKKGRRVSS